MNYRAQGLKKSGALCWETLFLQEKDMGVPKVRGTLLAAPKIRTIVFWGLYWGPPTLGNSHLCSGVFTGVPLFLRSLNVRAELRLRVSGFGACRFEIDECLEIKQSIRLLCQSLQFSSGTLSPKP